MQRCCPTLLALLRASAVKTAIRATTVYLGQQRPRDRPQDASLRRREQSVTTPSAYIFAVPIRRLWLTPVTTEITR